MTRTFIYNFTPPSLDPSPGATIALDVSDIEDAGIREVLQTPGAAYGAWSILDALLAPTGAGTSFLFRQPLGQAREVKVALSGLFGRFVTRAYLERYFDLSVFAHLGNQVIDLDRRKQARIKRLARGDLPDWIACKSDLTSLTIAEAKGCHDPGGPAKALARAWTQAGRIDVTVKGQKVTVKRIAVATRWGVANSNPANAHLSVRDPIDEGDPIDPQDKDAPFIGLLRLHVANMIEPLGHAELAQALRALTRQTFPRPLRDTSARARAILDGAAIGQMEKTHDIGGLVGGIVTRAGPITDAIASTVDQDALARLNLRPVFVGVDRDLIRAAIDGEAETIRGRLAQKGSPDEVARPDRAGGWIIPLGAERHIIGGG
ncbi:MAG: hypothetical protein Q8R45_00415 [Brevundimonas sp.]|uniref:hypothetical protein n=1 Tax=Brevundimonas sp. TaxID=1871086 RepID=UPI002734356B|nr:hypothetical protein [Brevundimonas sp.]MDP3655417.1 hypothetical protein [Brevundimonas sp.]MDZ4067295.1 hypothetical protein [Tabrizicola sp.]